MFGPTRHLSKFRLLVTNDEYDVLDQLLTILIFLGGGGGQPPTSTYFFILILKSSHTCHTRHIKQRRRVFDV